MFPEQDQEKKKKKVARETQQNQVAIKVNGGQPARRLIRPEESDCRSQNKRSTSLQSLPCPYSIPPGNGSKGPV